MLFISLNNWMIQVLTQLCILLFLLMLLCNAKMKVSFANKCFCGVRCQSGVKFNFHSLKIRSYKSHLSDTFMVFISEGDLTLYICDCDCWASWNQQVSEISCWGIWVPGRGGMGFVLLMPPLDWLPTDSVSGSCHRSRLWWAWGLGKGSSISVGIQTGPGLFHMLRSMASLLIFNYCGIIGKSLNFWLLLLHLLKIGGLPWWLSGKEYACQCRKQI